MYNVWIKKISLVWICSFFVFSSAWAQYTPIETGLVQTNVTESIPFLAIVNVIVAVLVIAFSLMFLVGIFEKITAGGVEVLNLHAHKRLLKAVVGLLGTFIVYGIILLISSFF